MRCQRQAIERRGIAVKELRKNQKQLVLSIPKFSEPFCHLLAKINFMGGLVVMGGDSHSESRGVESQCLILDGHLKNAVGAFLSM